MLSEENPASSSYDEVRQYLSTDFTSPNDVLSSSSGKKKKRPKKQKSRPKLDSDVVDSSLPHKGSSEGGEYEGRAEATQHRLSHVESPSVSEDSEVGTLSLINALVRSCVILSYYSAELRANWSTAMLLQIRMYELAPSSLPTGRRKHWSNSTRPSQLSHQSCHCQSGWSSPSYRHQKGMCITRAVISEREHGCVGPVIKPFGKERLWCFALYLAQTHW